MLKIYGNMLCPDCVQCCKDLDGAGVEYEYRDIAADLRALKEFLHFRDSEALFAPVKEAGAIGIPCIVREDGSVTLEWEKLI